MEKIVAAYDKKNFLKYVNQQENEKNTLNIKNVQMNHVQMKYFFFFYLHFQHSIQ